ncbi:hypothetical protein PV328_001031 [Microctonus aethiopoides]|uniref:DDE Tnp4 domain-containing protein n=1 Tax=Microctonus aethiopoides TaxID=144406 RepID=A0AA39KWV8_9HYME|nr:hypothetical protein PV328_001031 [Microctonus aethiopoides]
MAQQHNISYCLRRFLPIYSLFAFISRLNAYSTGQIGYMQRSGVRDNTDASVCKFLITKKIWKKLSEPEILVVFLVVVDDGNPWKLRSRSRICSQHFVGGEKSEHPNSPAYLQDNIPRKNLLETKEHRKSTITSTIKSTAEIGCRPIIQYADEKVGRNPLNENDSLLSYQQGFQGFSSIKDEQDLIDIAGVSFSRFQLLLEAAGNCYTGPTVKNNMLLIFLIKMKLGLTYSSIGVLFVGKKVIIVMPPCLQNGTFTADEVRETQKNASLRIDVERIMQRIKTYQITKNLPLSDFGHSDNIIFMACVSVNLQPPIIRSNESKKVFN